jgi:hypothetical protein
MGPVFEDIKVHVRFRLFALWSSLMFLYIYGDYFELYQPGKLAEMLAGRTALGVSSPTALLGLSALMAVPSLMAFLSLVLPARVNRWVNVLLGIAYAAIVLLAILGSWSYYIFLGCLEIALSLLIVWQAWTWPRLR